MSRPSGSQRQQRVVIFTLLIAAACAVQTSKDTLGTLEAPATGGTGGDMEMGVGGSVGSGGSDPGTGGTDATSGGTGGASATGGTSAVGGSAMGGGAGKGAGGSAAGKGGSLGTGGATTGGTGTGGGAGRGAGGSAGVNAAGGSAGKPATGGTGGRAAGGSAGTFFGMGGRGAAGTGAGGIGTAGSGTAGSAGASTADCITTLKAGDSSGNLGKNAVCYDVTATMNGWTLSNLGARTLTVNGMPAPTPPTVPAAVSGHRIFQFGAAAGGANDPSLYTNWGYW